MSAEIGRAAGTAPYLVRWCPPIGRRYHSTALLLPDGTVMAAGTDGEYTTEIFFPPYLFRGPRPTITTAPTTLNYGSAFQLVSPDSADIRSVVLIGLSAVTHSFNQTQRYVQLSFSTGAGMLNVDAPPDGNHAPPGYYLLFVVNAMGVPAEARIVRVRERI